MPRIKVLHCVETIGSGGVERTRLSLARYLDKSRFEQKVVCTRTEGQFHEHISAEGMEVIPVGRFQGPFHLERYRQVMEVIKRYRPDIIHGAVFEGVTMAAVCGAWARVPGVIVEETSYPTDRSWKGNQLMRVLSAAADRVVAVSPSVGDYLSASVGLKPPRLRIINNGVELLLPAPADTVRALRSSLRIDPGDVVVGSVGRLLDSCKRFSDLIRALSLLRLPRLKLLIVGDGPDREALESLAVSLGVADSVVFAGYQPDTAPYYGCMDIFALASAMEAFGLVLVEAMMLKLPVVATSVGGIRDVVTDGVTGWLVERFAPEQLAARIESLYRDDAGRRRFGESGYTKAMHSYTAAAYAAEVEKLYLDVYENSKGHLFPRLRRSGKGV